MSEPAEDTKAWVAWFEKQSADYNWCLSQPEILDRYRGQVLVVQERNILGSGRDSLQALHDAQERLARQNQPFPPRRDVLFVVIPEQPWFDMDFYGPPRDEAADGEVPGPGGH
jgi:hypothetical protein